MNLYDVGARLAGLLPAEAAHRATITMLKTGMVKPAPELDHPKLATELKRSGLKLNNPVGLAAGFDKNAEAYLPMLAFGFGFVECGTVTPRPQRGNPKPRLFRLPEDRAVINRMGFNNDGLGLFVRRLSASPRGIGVIGANVGANKDSTDRIADYVAGVKAVWPYCSYLTINVSSPNTPGLRSLQDRGALEELLGRVGVAAKEMEAVVKNRPMFLKVAPDLDDKAIADIVDVSKAAPYLHGLIVSNTTVARPETLQGAYRSEPGGLSGAPLMAVSTAVLKAFAGELKGALDLIGAGGISSGADVWRKLCTGASAVQLYSALAYQGPQLVRRIKSELVEIMQAEGVERLADIVGKG